MRFSFVLLVALSVCCVSAASSKMDPMSTDETFSALEQTIRRLEKQVRKNKKLKPEDVHIAGSLLSSLQASFVQESGQSEDRKDQIAKLAERLDVALGIPQSQVIASPQPKSRRANLQKQKDAQQTPQEGMTIIIITQEALLNHFVKVETARNLLLSDNLADAEILAKQALAFYQILPVNDINFEVFKQRRIQVCESILDCVNSKRRLLTMQPANSADAERSNESASRAEVNAVKAISGTRVVNKENCEEALATASMKIAEIVHDLSSPIIAASSFRALARNEWTFLVECRFKQFVSGPSVSFFVKTFCELHHGLIVLSHRLLADANTSLDSFDLQSCESILEQTRVLLEALSCSSLPIIYEQSLDQAKRIWKQLHEKLPVAFEKGQSRFMTLIQLNSAESNVDSSDPETIKGLMISIPSLLETLKHDAYDRDHGSKLYRRALAVWIKLKKSNPSSID